MEANAAQQAMHQELMGVLTAHIGLTAGAAVSRPTPSMFILKQTETDDIQAYLQTFVRKEKWPPGPMGPFLSGAAQKVYQDLTKRHTTRG